MDTQNQDPTSPDRLVAATEAPKMYTELASWWPLLSPPGDYTEEAAFYLRALIEACERPPHTLLELGSGGGNNASHLKSRFQMVLVDLSPGMLAVSRRLNPEREHVEGDMRTVRLGRQFDCVFVHDAIVYMTTEADLRKAIETAFVHCRPGGAAFFAPDHIKENFRPSTDFGGHDGERESLRYLEWTFGGCTRGICGATTAMAVRLPPASKCSAHLAIPHWRSRISPAWCNTHRDMLRACQSIPQ